MPARASFSRKVLRITASGENESWSDRTARIACVVSASLPLLAACAWMVSGEGGTMMLENRAGEQPSIMDRALFESVRQKSLVQWSHRTVVRNNSDHLLTGLLFDGAGHRMVPTHATKAGVRYRYYVSMPFLHGEAKTASAG